VTDRWSDDGMTRIAPTDYERVLLEDVRRLEAEIAALQAYDPSDTARWKRAEEAVRIYLRAFWPEPLGGLTLDARAAEIIHRIRTALTLPSPASQETETR
jgi:hypothetical protein